MRAAPYPPVPLTLDSAVRAAQPRMTPPSGRRGNATEFGACPDAVPSARHHARAVLQEWGLGDLGDDAAQIVSELVTNAVEAHRREGLAAPVRLTLLAGLRTVLIVVRDAGGGTPVAGRPGEDGEDGRGLLIVDALADRWDSKSCPAGGKVVRALLRGKRRT